MYLSRRNGVSGHAYSQLTSSHKGICLDSNGKRLFRVPFVADTLRISEYHTRLGYPDTLTQQHVHDGNLFNLNNQITNGMVSVKEPGLELSTLE